MQIFLAGGNKRVPILFQRTDVKDGIAERIK
jgi:hypothetical protein